MKKFTLLPICLVVFGLFISGCSNPPSDFLEGEIISTGGDFSNIQPNAEFNGLMSYSNETIKINTGNVVFTVKTELGNYTIQLAKTNNAGPQTVENMKFVLKKGVKIKFPTKYHMLKRSVRGKMGFSKSKIGIVYTNDIEILQ